jgi:hypothetical protein
VAIIGALEAECGDRVEAVVPLEYRAVDIQRLACVGQSADS